jgi:transcriptional regulator with XRE-family HTH domain
MSTGHLNKSTLVKKLGEAVRQRREALGLSQESLAEAAAFDRTYISLIERGQRNPSFTNLCRLAAALDTSPSDLLQGLSFQGRGRSR